MKICVERLVSSGFLLYFILLIIGSGCHQPQTNIKLPEKKPDLSVFFYPGDSITVPGDPSEIVYEGLYDTAIVRSFYAFKNFKPFWLKDNAPTPMADSMLQFIRSARFYGLLPQDYHWKEIEGLLAQTHVHRNNYGLIRTEVLLTDAFFRLESNLKNGRLDNLGNVVPRKNASADSTQTRINLLQMALKGQGLRKILESQEPDFDMYRKLKSGHRELLQSTDQNQRELLLSGITIDSLETNKKIVTLEINLERCRWENDKFQDRYILINIPSFQLQVLESGQVALESRVIVGTTKTPTPNLSSIIEHIVIYPTWTLPRKIAVSEYLPKIQNDSTYLTRNNFDVLDKKGNILNASTIDWTKYHEDYFPIILRQREGPDNTLGMIKFVFDNPYAVYLHDTNEKKLFQRKSRAFSHACVRVEKAVDLAEYLIKYDSINLDEYLSLQQHKVINLTNPMPIHIRYFTCEYREGRIYFNKDVYGMDKELIDALYKETKIMLTDSP